MLTFLAAALLSGVLADSRGFKVGQTVQTASGEIIGQPSSWKPEVSEYLGIPYAEPPIGKLRWAAPVAIKAPGRTVNATKYAHSCMASISSSSASLLSAMGVEMGPQSEDCLYINVWTKPQTGEKKKAVMVWIDGRAFTVGGGSDKAYNGALLADEDDVVVVNMNYRMGVLGFANAWYMPDMNFGLLDQRMVVEWVRDNIEAFGGDPSRITLFGQSGGSSSIDYYTFAYPNDPIAHAFIQQSGTTILMAGTANNENWSKGAKSLGCEILSNKTVIDCMRNKPSQEIMSAFSGLDFGPSMDLKVVYREYLTPLAAGRFSRKPTLIGHTGNEMDTYSRRSMIKYQNPVPKESFDKSMKWMDQSFLICSIGRLAKARSERKIPTWLYSYAGDFPNQKTSPNLTTGPWHGSEVGLIFGTTRFTRELPDTPEQTELAKKMREAWTSFSKAPETALDKLNWPRYNPTESTVITLGGKNDGKITFTSAKGYDPSCLLLGLLEMIGGIL